MPQTGMTMLQIRTADKKDYNQVIEFYDAVIDSLEHAEYGPGWKRDIYPTKGFLSRSIESKELYVGETDGQIAACMVVNHEYNEGYKDIKWSVEAKDTELFVIHILAVHPLFAGRGIAKQMVRKIIETAQENHIKTIRLDVLDGNIPAERAYTKIGFRYLDTVQMFYEDTGWTKYKLFEFIV